jgi:predicted RecA/RadA family phage recombinase
MARTYQRPGLTLTYTAGGTISSGDVVVTGDIVGIALSDAVSGDEIEISIEGVHEVTKEAGTAWVQGDLISWDASESSFEKGPTPATGDVIGCGIAALAAASGDTTGYIKLTPGSGATE